MSPCLFILVYRVPSIAHAVRRDLGLRIVHARAVTRAMLLLVIPWAHVLAPVAEEIVLAVATSEFIADAVPGRRVIENKHSTEIGV